MFIILSRVRGFVMSNLGDLDRLIGFIGVSITFTLPAHHQ
jgi:hypothetical protein